MSFEDTLMCRVCSGRDPPNAMHDITRGNSIGTCALVFDLLDANLICFEDPLV